MTPLIGEVTFAPGSGSTVLKSVHAGEHERDDIEKSPVRGLPTSVDAKAPLGAVSPSPKTAVRAAAKLIRRILAPDFRVDETGKTPALRDPLTRQGSVSRAALDTHPARLRGSLLSR
jgi:hypothetical protein